MINTGQTTTTTITLIVIQEATTEVIKENQHGEDPDPTPEDQWLEEITTDQPFIKLTPTSMKNLKIDLIKKQHKQITPTASFSKELALLSKLV